MTKYWAAFGVASFAKLSSGDETSHEGHREKLHRRKLASEPHSRNQRQLVLRGAGSGPLAARAFRTVFGHRVFVLTVTYAGGRTRQFSVRRERVTEVRRWLNNYQQLKQDCR